ncbi:MAG: hypothetical protein S4CHLAM6_08140 [Chlamydiae bacterium]|nr:hypothetical protein [Chlamydiota bacterium]
MNKVNIPAQQLNKTSFPKICITYDRIADRLTQVFSPIELKEYLFLYEKSQENPKKALKDIMNFQRKHPELPEVYNLLCYTLIRRKKIRKAEKLVEENYQKNPQYLFARINYADQCLRKNKTAMVSEIFENKSHLDQLYPSRKFYHYSELLGFICLMGFYYLKLGERELAMDYCAYAKIIDPEDDTLALLEKKLHKQSFIQTIMKALNPKRNG